MKLFSVALGLVAAEVAVAHDVVYQDFIPYDCFRETHNQGNKHGTKTTDRTLISGLNITSSRMAAISACTSLETRLITGLVTVWGTWDSASGAWTNLQSMNVIGNMSGLQEFDDNAAIRSFKGGSFSLTTAQDVALMELWYSEASPNQKEHYANQVIDASWTSTRQTIFDEEDKDNDGLLEYEEAQKFL